jgi:pimeloyl-ACP methyl ester carboxylesterase
MKTPPSAQWQLTRFFHYRDDVIAWDTWGTGEPIVLLHGFPGNSFAWRKIAPELAKTHKVYVLDFMGFGSSSKYPLQAMDARSQAHMLVALFKEWGLEKPNIIAHDFGGLALVSAVLFNGLTYNKSVLLDPALLHPCLREISRHGRIHAEAYATMPAKLYAHLMRFILSSAMFQPMDEETFNGYFLPWSDREGQVAYYRYLQQFDDKHLDAIETRLHRITQPTSILWGQRDNWIPIEQGEALRQHMPNSQLVTIPDAGHFVMDDAPEIVLKHIRDFLDPTRS